MADQLVVRIRVTGHASRRWRGAANADEAARLNQALSERRARNVGRAVEEILRREVTSLKIEVPAAGVGSREPFPTASENNAAVDRSAVVEIEVATTQDADKLVPRPPRRIYSASRFWNLRVLNLLGGSAIGYKASFLRISLQNPFSGKLVRFAGMIHGGELSISLNRKGGLDPKKGGVDFGRNTKPSLNPVGDEVVFETEEAMDFDDWIRFAKDGKMIVRVVHGEIKALVHTKTTFLQFTQLDTHPGSLVFELKKFGFKLAMPNVDDWVASGILHAEDDNPGDYFEVPSLDDIIPTQVTSRNIDGILLSFPTGKDRVEDLAEDDRRRLAEFVTQKSRAIKALSEAWKGSFRVNP